MNASSAIPCPPLRFSLHSGRWLEELARQNQAPGFDLDRWILEWEAGVGGLQIPGRNQTAFLAIRAISAFDGNFTPIMHADSYFFVTPNGEVAVLR